MTEITTLTQSNFYGIVWSL